MSQHTPMLEDEKGLCDPGLLLGALLWLAPFQGLDLHLPVDAGKAASLLQHGLQAGLTVSVSGTVWNTSQACLLSIACLLGFEATGQLQGGGLFLE